MEYVELGRVIGGFLLVLAMIGVLALILRHPRIQKLAQGQSLKKSGRLQVVESFYLDAKHRLVLIRRDDKEHLILLGAGQHMLIESDITSAIPKENP